jgi:hypothetical protein
MMMQKVNRALGNLKKLMSKMLRKMMGFCEKNFSEIDL